MRLTLMRHGEPARGDVANGTDPGLSAAGIEQAEWAAPLVREQGYDVVVASPLRRARDTAHIATGGLPLHVDDDFSEFDRGYAYVHFEDGGDVWASYLRGDLTAWGTTLPEFHARVARGVSRLMESGAVNALVVCHGGVVNSWTCQTLRTPERIRYFEPAYTSLNVYELDAGGWRVRSLNEVASRPRVSL